MTQRVKKKKENKIIQRENARKKESKRINVVTRYNDVNGRKS